MQEKEELEMDHCEETEVQMCIRDSCIPASTV